MLITNADELINFSKSEEESMEKIVKPLAESGVTCVVSGGKIGELALHMLDKYQVRTFIKLFLLLAVYLWLPGNSFHRYDLCILQAHLARDMFHFDPFRSLHSEFAVRL